MSQPELQYNSEGRLCHCLDTEGMTPELVTEILDLAESFADINSKTIKKVPLLRGHTVVNLFFESSTRTRTTFELAAKRLSADVLNIDIEHSATTKGESLLDTVANLHAMQCDLFVLRHPESGAAEFVAQNLGSQGVQVINAGDGIHAHPTQALLDVFTIRRHKPDFANLRIAIFGDIQHSRVARSEIHALRALGTRDIRVAGPPELLPPDPEVFGVASFDCFEEAIDQADVVIMLRLQKERMAEAMLPGQAEYHERWGLTEERLKLAKPDAMVMHPGPTNREVEIASTVADGPQSVILEQVTNGIAVRMAVMSMIAGVAPTG